MKCAIITLVIAGLVLLSQASLPSRKSLRFNEVTGSNLSPNSVSESAIQDWSVSNSMLQSESVTGGKIANWAINNQHIAPGAVTSSGLAIDIVKLIISDEFTKFAPDQKYPAPTGVESILPVENWYFGHTIVDNPDPALGYRVQSRAKGPGVILGWYPTKNGHLLRYQAGRSLRGLSCMDVAINNINIANDCVCSVEDNDADFTPSCSCTVTSTYLTTDWAFSNTQATYTPPTGTTPPIRTGLFANFDCDFPAGICTSMAGCPITNNDPQCVRRPPTRDFTGRGSSPDGQQPDRCSTFTSVEDVNDPQEGIPSYSPSVESITINGEGVVEMNFFGRGSWQVAAGEIEISVVVLLDEQYGA